VRQLRHHQVKADLHIGNQMAVTRTKFKTKACPFRIVVDSAETHPFTFDGIHGDSRDGGKLLEIETLNRSLGRHPYSFGDYTIERPSDLFNSPGDGHWAEVDGVAVERKSMEDAHSTILGFTDGHRERFESELSNLARCSAAMVVVECDLCEMLLSAPSFGTRTAKQNAKTLMSSVLAFQQDYGVPWVFAGSRRMAEVMTFRFLERFWRKNVK